MTGAVDGAIIEIPNKQGIIHNHSILPSSSVVTVTIDVSGPIPMLVLAATAHVYVVNGNKPVMVM